MPAEKYAEDEGMRLPESLFLQTVTGEYPDDDSAIHPSEIDIVLTGDPKTIRVVPWAAEPTAQVIHDCFYDDGRPVPMCWLSDVGRYWVSTPMSKIPEFTQFDSVKSMIRYLPANGTAGFARRSDSRHRRLPTPPALAR